MYANKQLSLIFLLHNKHSLQELEQSLQEIQALGGSSLKELERQLETSKEIWKTCRRNYKAALLQNLLTVMMTLDRDGNLLLSDEEIDELIDTLKSIRGIEHMDIDRFRAAIIEKGRSLQAVMEVARNVIESDNRSREAIFQFDENVQQ